MEFTEKEIGYAVQVLTALVALLALLCPRRPKNTLEIVPEEKPEKKEPALSPLCMEVLAELSSDDLKVSRESGIPNPAHVFRTPVLLIRLGDDATIRVWQYDGDNIVANLSDQFTAAEDEAIREKAEALMETRALMALGERRRRRRRPCMADAEIPHVVMGTSQISSAGEGIFRLTGVDKGNPVTWSFNVSTPEMLENVLRGARHMAEYVGHRGVKSLALALHKDDGTITPYGLAV